MAMHKPRTQVSEEINPVGTSIWDLQSLGP